VGVCADSTCAIHPQAIVRKSTINPARRGVWLLCLMASAQRGTAQFVEISAEIEHICYRSGQTNAEASAAPRIISVVCITGTNNWRIEHDWTLGGLNKWFFDGCG
jgi:hypothetical protein